MRKFVSGLLAVFSLFLPAWAADRTLSLESYALKTSPAVTFGYVLQLVFSLLVVIGLVYVTTKYLIPKLQIKTKGRLIEVLDRIGLEPQVSAYLLKVKKACWLVVVSNKQVAKIDKIEEDLSIP